MTLQDLGKDIRAQRELSGLTLDDVAARIKVSARTLQAIENGKTDTLPHAVYTRGFVRSFATVVGFNQDDLNARLEEVFPMNGLDNPKPDMGPLVRTPSSPGVAKKIFLLASMLGLMAGIGVGIWYVAATHGDTLWEFVKQPFSALTTPASPETTAGTAENSGPGSVASATVNGTVSSSASLTPPDSGIPASGTSSATPWITDASAAEYVAGNEAAQNNSVPPVEQAVSSTVSGTVPTSQAVASIPQPRGPDSGKQVVVVAKANQECWIGYRTDASQNKEYFTLTQGQTRTFSYASSLELTLGNAGGVSVLDNGKDLGTIGKEKEVKTLRF